MSEQLFELNFHAEKKPLAHILNWMGAFTTMVRLKLIDFERNEMWFYQSSCQYDFAWLRFAFEREQKKIEAVWCISPMAEWTDTPF